MEELVAGRGLLEGPTVAGEGGVYRWSESGV